MRHLTYAALKATLYRVEFRGDTPSPFAPTLIVGRWRSAKMLLAIKLCEVSTDGFGAIPRFDLKQQFLVLDVLVNCAPGTIGISLPSQSVLLAQSPWRFVLDQLGDSDGPRFALA